MGRQVNIAILAPGTFRWFLIDKQALLKNKQANRQTNPTWEFSSGLAILCFPKGPAFTWNSVQDQALHPQQDKATNSHAAHRSARASSFLRHKWSCKAAEATQPGNLPSLGAAEPVDGLVMYKVNACSCMAFYIVLLLILWLGKSSCSGDFYKVCVVSNLQYTTRPDTAQLASLFRKDDNSTVFLAVLTDI